MRLRAAIEASDYSIRSLARALSQRPDMGSNEDSIRRTLSEKLSGRQAIGDHYATVLEDQLGLPMGELHEQDYSRVLTLATQLVRRLDAGEDLPAATLLELADATEAAARVALLFADRLRREAETRQ